MSSAKATNKHQQASLISTRMLEAKRHLRSLQNPNCADKGTPPPPPAQTEQAFGPLLDASFPPQMPLQLLHINTQ